MIELGQKVQVDAGKGLIVGVRLIEPLKGGIYQDIEYTILLEDGQHKTFQTGWTELIRSLRPKDSKRILPTTYI